MMRIMVRRMRFAFVENWRHLWSVEAMCRVMQVNPRGYRSWRVWPMSRHDRTDMKMLAHTPNNGERERYNTFPVLGH